MDRTIPSVIHAGTAERWSEEAESGFHFGRSFFLFFSGWMNPISSYLLGSSARLSIGNLHFVYRIFFLFITHASSQALHSEPRRIGLGATRRVGVDLIIN